MKVKKFAQKFYKVNNLVIWRRKEDQYWITDIHCIIILDIKEMKEFINKYNGYKRTVNIPEINIGDQIEISNSADEWEECDLNLKQYIKPLPENEVILTDIFYKQQVRLIRSKDYIIGIDTDYVDYLNKPELRQESKDDSIYIIDNGIKAIVAPYKPETERYDKMWEDLKAIVGKMEVLS